MAELTIEDKAKRFDEALNKAKSKIKNDKEHVLYEDDVLEIFPEIKENEDERIRKTLIDFFDKDAFDCGDKSEWVNGIKYKDVVAWLEKQGEQKQIETNEGATKIISDVVGFIRDGALPKDKKEYYIEKLLSLRPQHTWKPSKELLANLQAIYDYHGCDFSSDGRQGIKKLLEQLKAL